MHGLVTQSCPTLYDRMDCSPPGSSVLRVLQARILEWVVIPFPMGIFSTQGLNLGLLHCRQILYHLSHQGSPDYSEDDKMTMKSCMYQVKIHDLQLSEENTFYVKQYISP